MSVGSRTVAVQWHIIDEDCEPVLFRQEIRSAGYNQVKPSFINPHVCLNDRVPGEEKHPRYYACYPENFHGLGTLDGYAVKIHVDNRVKLVAEPPRWIPYHLESRVQESVNEMLQNGVIEEILLVN